jgi:hypothetical protein
VNRGGLFTPSDATYVACVHAWDIFKLILDTPDSREALLKATEPQKVFLAVVQEIIDSIDHLSDLVDASCGKNHLFKKQC